MASRLAICPASFMPDDFSEYTYPDLLRGLSTYGHTHRRVECGEFLRADSVRSEPLHQVCDLRLAAEQTNVGGFFLCYNL